MSGHTPGPWTLCTTMLGPVTMGWHIAASPHGSTLPVCLSDKYSEYRDQGQEIANARLIAAAPELLEALQAIVKSLADQDDEGLIEHAEQMIAARAAIAKATGEAP